AEPESNIGQRPRYDRYHEGVELVQPLMPPAPEGGSLCQFIAGMQQYGRQAREWDKIDNGGNKQYGQYEPHPVKHGGLPRPAAGVYIGRGPYNHSSHGQAAQ